MKRNVKGQGAKRNLLWIVSVALACMLALYGLNASGILESNVTAQAYAEATAGNAAVSEDPSPAVYVAQKNANSVVGVITNTQSWNRSTGEVESAPYSQGSGVVIADKGYILTNYHVIEGGDSYQVLMPNGEKVDATMTGYDSSLDLAVIQVEEKSAEQLTPASIGTSSNLIVGSTVVAIGNPGGEVLANTVTQGIVSALERSDVSTTNTTRNVDYIQHDAAINAGNSGGGLFDYQGNLIGINTLKYSGSVYSSVTFEGLGFAIPIDTAYPIAQQLIENGKVIRPQMGVTVADFEGPDEPMSNYAPASVCIYGVNEDSPAQKAGLEQYDFIYAINDERVTSFRELTAALDHYSAGDKVSVTVVRYENVAPVSSNNNYYNSIFGNYYGGYGYGYGNNGQDNSGMTDSAAAGNTVTDLAVSGGFEYVTVDVTLELPEEE